MAKHHHEFQITENLQVGADLTHDHDGTLVPMAQDGDWEGALNSDGPESKLGVIGKFGCPQCNARIGVKVSVVSRQSLTIEGGKAAWHHED